MNESSIKPSDVITPLPCTSRDSGEASVRAVPTGMSMSALSTFIAANRAICKAITPRHLHEANVFGMYRKIGTMLLSHPGVRRVADIGAGKAWQFPAEFKKWYSIHLIGLDIDGAEMEVNTALDEKIVCDVVEAIPLAPNSVDMVMAHSGVEHFSDNQRFMCNVHSILRPGGVALLQFPGRFAPFAIANRMLPKAISRRFLNATRGEDAEELGFRAHYDRTNYSAFARIAREAGFEPLYYVPGYYSSDYCSFLVPLYLAHYAYDALRYAAGIRNLASYNLWVLRKPGSPGEEIALPLTAWEWSGHGWGSR